MNLHNLIARDLSLIDVFYSIIINLNKSLLFLSPAHPLTRMEYFHEKPPLSGASEGFIGDGHEGMFELRKQKLIREAIQIDPKKAIDRRNHHLAYGHCPSPVFLQPRSSFH